MNCLEYITKKGYKPEKVGNETYRVNPCPFCNHNDTFTIFNHTNSWYCFSEGKGGGIAQLQQSFGEETSTRADNTIITYLVSALYDYIPRTDYYSSRGLRKTIERYRLGFSPTGLNFFAGKIPSIVKPNTEEKERFYSCYKYILPFWDADNQCRYFIARRDEESAKAFKEVYGRDIPKTYNLPNQPSRVFNARYLEKPPDRIFIVEGIFDALSLEEEGYYAIALNSVSNFNKFLELCKTHKNKLEETEFILIPDNDTAGQRLVKHFRDEFIFNVKTVKLPECKDVNEYSLKYQGLKERIEELISRDNPVFWVADYIEDFFNNIGRQKLIRTGFNRIDDYIGGGLRPGLTIFGGLTSLGKTSFILQLAYNIAKDIPVFYFALEESRLDLMAKLFSMISYKYGIKLPTIDVMRGNFQIPQEDALLIIESLRSIGENIAIFEGMFSTSALNIRNELEGFVSTTGRTPVVIVDYIQILKPPDLSFRTDKQALDFTVSELKRIARDFDTLIIGISSINRSSYSTEFTYESLKESGGIEYTADVIMGLQLPSDERNDKGKNIVERMKSSFKKEPVDLQIKILKNRYGMSHQTVDLKFYPKYSYYEE